jgi:hypothetical protein
MYSFARNLSEHKIVFNPKVLGLFRPIFTRRDKKNVNIFFTRIISGEGLSGSDHLQVLFGGGGALCE